MKKLFGLLFFIAVCLYPYVADAQKTCTRVTATSQNCLITATWTASLVDATHDAPTSYVIRRKDGAGSMVEIGTVSATITTFQNTFTDAGNVAHCWDAIARKVTTSGNIDSLPSNQACWTTPSIVTTAPSTPGGFTISALDSTTLKLTWDDVDREDSYEVWGKPAKGAGRQFTKLVTLPPDTVTWNWTGLKPNSSNCAHVRAANVIAPSIYTPTQCGTTNSK